MKKSSLRFAAACVAVLAGLSGKDAAAMDLNAHLAAMLEAQQQVVGHSARPDVEAVEAAFSNLTAETRQLIDACETQSARHSARAVLADHGQVAKALDFYARRRKVEAQGALVLRPSAPDWALFFKLRGILQAHGQTELLDQIYASDTRALLDELLAADVDAPESPVAQRVRAFLSPVPGPAGASAEELKAALDSFCRVVSGWRSAPGIAQLPGFADVSWTACHARLASRGADAAIEEYSRHVALVLQYTEPEVVASTLMDEADAMEGRRLCRVARALLLLVPEEAREGDLFLLARLRAAELALEAGDGAAQGCAEARALFKPGMATALLAPVMLDAASTCWKLDDELGYALVEAALGDLSVQARPSALSALFSCRLRQGRTEDAIALSRRLEAEFPQHASTEYAMRTLREQGLLAQPEPDTGIVP